MCKQYLAYKIPTDHISNGECDLIPGKFQTCGCGQFVYFIIGRYRTKTDLLVINKTDLKLSNKSYSKRYPFRVFKLSKGLKKNGDCKMCDIFYVSEKTQEKKYKKTQKITNSDSLSFTRNCDDANNLSVEEKLNQPLDTTIRKELNLLPHERIPEPIELEGDSLSKKTTKEKLDDELDQIYRHTWKNKGEDGYIRRFDQLNDQLDDIKTEKCGKQCYLLTGFSSINDNDNDNSISDFSESEEYVRI